jgi:hypothetical protein
MTIHEPVIVQEMPTLEWNNCESNIADRLLCELNRAGRYYYGGGILSRGVELNRWLAAAFNCQLSRYVPRLSNGAASVRANLGMHFSALLCNFSKSSFGIEPDITLVWKEGETEAMVGCVALAQPRRLFTEDGEGSKLESDIKALLTTVALKQRSVLQVESGNTNPSSWLLPCLLLSDHSVYYLTLKTGHWWGDTVNMEPVKQYVLYKSSAGLFTIRSVQQLLAVMEMYVSQLLTNPVRDNLFVKPDELKYFRFPEGVHRLLKVNVTMCTLDTVTEYLRTSQTNNALHSRSDVHDKATEVIVKILSSTVYNEFTCAKTELPKFLHSLQYIPASQRVKSLLDHHIWIGPCTRHGHKMMIVTQFAGRQVCKSQPLIRQLWSRESTRRAFYNQVTMYVAISLAD